MANFKERREALLAERDKLVKLANEHADMSRKLTEQALRVDGAIAICDEFLKAEDEEAPKQDGPAPA
jgi:hypothetical protein